MSHHASFRLFRGALAGTAVLLGLGSPQVAVAESATPPMFSFSRVGDLGGAASFALDVAPNGMVVGTARTGAASRPQLAYVDDGAVTSLGTLPGSSFSRAMSVNARGEAVGEAFTADAESSRAVLWDADGFLRVLPGLRGPDTSAVANAINHRGDVAGVSTALDGRGTAVVWPRGGAPEPLEWLADVPGAISRAWDIGPSGVVVGASSVPDDDDHLHSHAVRWDRGGVPADLGVLEEHGTSVAYAAGQSSRVVAVGEASQDGRARATAFTSGGAEALPTPGEFRHARANDVNADGWIVGHAAQFQGAPTFGGVAVLWVDGLPYDLNSLVTGLPTGWRLLSAEAVNNGGEIVGYGTADGEVRGFRLTPVGAKVAR